VMWKNGRATEARLRPDVDGERIIRPPRGQRIAAITANGAGVEMRDTRAALKAGKEYVVTFQAPR
jgi:hypothetical protein